MYRLADMECDDCGTRQETLVDVPQGERIPKIHALWCEACESETMHALLISAPARYMGETALNPIVSGGQFDTTGHRAPPPLPDLPGAEEHNAKLGSMMGQAANAEDRREVFRDMERHAPSDADYSALFGRPEYKNAEAERKRVHAENKQKRARHAALKRGETVNFRRDKCAGDPNMAA